MVCCSAVRLPLAQAASLAHNIHYSIARRYPIYYVYSSANSPVHFIVHFCFPSIPAERPKLYLSLTPTISIAIGITSALLIGGCAILIGLRLSNCQNHSRHHHHRHNNGSSADAQRSLKITSKPILYNGSPGSSNKSGSHKDDDGEGDEKNPDVIPDSSEEQVSILQKTTD